MSWILTVVFSAAVPDAACSSNRKFRHGSFAVWLSSSAAATSAVKAAAATADPPQHRQHEYILKQGQQVQVVQN